MTEPHTHLLGRASRAPRAAAVAGIIFAVLQGTSYALLLTAVPPDSLGASSVLPLKTPEDGYYLSEDLADDAINWLLALDGPFALRIYWPQQDILDGKWEPAAIKKA